MARGFGSTLGSGTTDSIEIPFNSHASQRTYSVWAAINGSGGGGLGRIFDKNTGSGEVELWHITADVQVSGVPGITYGRDWSTNGRWDVKLFGIVGDNTWHHHLVTYDSGAISNDATIYLDGSAQSLDGDVNPTGTLKTNSDDYVMGNRKTDNGRVFDGALFLFSIWDRILNSTEIAFLAANGHPEAIPTGLVSSVPMIGSGTADTINGACTVVGTAVVADPFTPKFLVPTGSAVLTGQAGRMDLGIPTPSMKRI